MESHSYVRSSRTLNPLESTGRRIGGFFGSIVGFFIGLILVLIVAPYLIYQSEFQYTLQNFEKAMPGDTGTPQNGYVYLFGLPQLSKPNPCPLVAQTECLFYAYEKEKLVPKQGILCGSELNNKIELVKGTPAPDKCRKQVVRRGGADVEQEICKKCYNATWKAWEAIEQNSKRASFFLGTNKINPSASTRYLFLETAMKEETIGNEQFRENSKYIPVGENVLAVGDAANGVMASGNPFIISSRGFEATKEALAQEQAKNTLLLKIFGFIIFFVGFAFMFRPISAFIEIFGGIPLLGEAFVWIGGLTGIVSLAISAALAIILTILLTIIFAALRIFVDNILAVILISLALIIVLFFVGGKVFKSRQ